MTEMFLSARCDKVQRGNDEYSSMGVLRVLSKETYGQDARATKGGFEGECFRNNTKGHKRTERDTKGQHFFLFFLQTCGCVAFLALEDGDDGRSV
jgi:hypothetical protein